MDVVQFRDALLGQGLADRTAAEYVKWLRRLHAWCATHGVDPVTAPAPVVRTWADTLPRSWASRKQARNALAHYYRLVGRLDEPWKAVRVPRKPRPQYRGLSEADARTLRDAALIIGGRQGLATLVGLYTGARASEIAGLRWDGVDYAAETIRWWRSKTSEWHSVPLHPVLAEALREAHDGTRKGPVFMGNNGRVYVSPATVWGWVRHVGEMVSIDVSPHQLRATAGTLVLEVTRDLDAAAEFLGHRDPSVTRGHYTRTSQVRLRAAVEALEF